MSDPLHAESIQRILQTKLYGRSIDVLASTISTSDDAKEAAHRGAVRGHVVVADTQRKGRGAHGHVWTSPAGTDLYLSIVEQLDVSPQALPALTLAVGLGVADTVDALTGQRSLVKWPNDVWLLEKKCAGILVESSSTGMTLGPVVIGIGLNVNRDRWDDDLAPIATSLRTAKDGCAFDRVQVLCELLARVERRVDQFTTHGAGPIVRDLNAKLALRGERVTVEGYGEGVLEGLTDDGAVRLSTSDGPRVAVTGTLRRAR
ncbi:MAG: biotin--[acetyl-CoA-carboxylase] ligase [Sandaracinaceae bacterium]|jgi:BirA family biotin operon repressor/biotin-[acetyl-CoA-carboxylase] ligase|nr:biotin--[acetyl-CoA-carboxylase] ligase [Sandaracinaceae bacterium]